LSAPSVVVQRRMGCRSCRSEMAIPVRGRTALSSASFRRRSDVRVFRNRVGRNAQFHVKHWRRGCRILLHPAVSGTLRSRLLGEFTATRCLETSKVECGSADPALISLEAPHIPPFQRAASTAHRTGAGPATPGPVSQRPTRRQMEQRLPKSKPGWPMRLVSGAVMRRDYCHLPLLPRRLGFLRSVPAIGPPLGPSGRSAP
jgi:hypothetical protein